MFVEKTFTSWNSSTGNCTSGIIHVEIITLVLYFGADQGALFYVQPAYEDALTDTGRAFPCLAVRQNIIYLPDKSIDKCTDLIPLTPDILAQYYYRHSDRWDAANVTTFLTNTAGIVRVLSSGSMLADYSRKADRSIHVQSSCQPSYVTFGKFLSLSYQQLPNASFTIYISLLSKLPDNYLILETSSPSKL